MAEGSAVEIWLMDAMLSLETKVSMVGGGGAGCRSCGELLAAAGSVMTHVELWAGGGWQCRSLGQGAWSREWWGSVQQAPRSGGLK